MTARRSERKGVTRVANILGFNGFRSVAAKTSRIGLCLSSPAPAAGGGEGGAVSGQPDPLRGRAGQRQLEANFLGGPTMTCGAAGRRRGDSCDRLAARSRAREERRDSRSRGTDGQGARAREFRGWGGDGRSSVHIVSTTVNERAGGGIGRPCAEGWRALLESPLADRGGGRGSGGAASRGAAGVHPVLRPGVHGCRRMCSPNPEMCPLFSPMCSLLGPMCLVFRPMCPVLRPMCQLLGPMCPVGLHRRSPCLRSGSLDRGAECRRSAAGKPRGAEQRRLTVPAIGLRRSGRVRRV